MNTFTYYIYHIAGVKIGLTKDLEKRMREQGFTEWEILWQEDGDWDFGWIAGDKELELQKEYGLPVDKRHYMVTVQMLSYDKKGRPSPLRGRSLTEETKRKISESITGTILSEETKSKIGDFHRGKVVSEETKHKMSIHQKGKSKPTTACPKCGIQISDTNLSRHLSRKKSCT